MFMFKLIPYRSLITDESKYLERRIAEHDFVWIAALLAVNAC